jgi:hypothetical protein
VIEAGSRFSPEAAIRLLLSQGLLTPADVVHGDITVHAVPGRNDNLSITLDTGRGYFIKHAIPGEDASSLEVEAAIYRAAAGSGDGACAALVPRVAHFDATRRLLVLDLVPSAWTGHDWPGRDAPNGPAHLGERVGAALATWHTTARPTAEIEVAAPRHPWALDLHRPVIGALRELSPAQLHLIAALQANVPACLALDTLRDGWTGSAVIHGDVKWSNVLVDADGPAGSGAVWLVDWEFAAWGDPAWDVGSMWHAFLLDCVADATDDADTPGDAAATFARGLPAVQPGIAASWRAYGRRHGAADDPAFGQRAVLSCAARLLQTAWEACYAQPAVPRTAAATLQLGLNVLVQPAAAASQLLGIDVMRPDG